MGLLAGIRYAVGEVRANYRDRGWWRDRLVQRVVSPVHTGVYPTYAGSVDPMAEEWDVLVVLDACRADLFEERVDRSRFDGYRVVTSGGSSTPEWTRRNFADRAFGDTVYVTSNPWTSTIAGDSFHRVVEVWRDAFDEERGTVPPGPVADAGREAAEAFPDKRVIVHFMQPHFPFLAGDLEFDGWSATDIVEGTVGTRDTVWEALRRGEVDREAVWEGYGRNLEYVFEYVEDFLSEVTGRVVVTADHGNMVGERAWPVPMRVYGHPDGLRAGPLVRVPWAVADGPRREVVDDGVTAVEADADDRGVDERLRALGYKG